MNENLPSSDWCITVADVTKADAGYALDRATIDEMSMAPPLVAAEGYARPHLSIVPRDVIAAAVEEVDLRIAPKGEMHEYPPCIPGGKVLFRYIEADGAESTYAINADRLTPRARTLLWQLAELVEEEGRT